MTADMQKTPLAWFAPGKERFHAYHESQCGQYNAEVSEHLGVFKAEGLLKSLKKSHETISFQLICCSASFDGSEF